MALKKDEDTFYRSCEKGKSGIKSEGGKEYLISNKNEKQIKTVGHILHRNCLLNTFLKTR
jgi:hypothetical protein